MAAADGARWLLAAPAPPAEEVRPRAARGGSSRGVSSRGVGGGDGGRCRRRAMPVVAVAGPGAGGARPGFSRPPDTAASGGELSGPGGLRSLAVTAAAGLGPGVSFSRNLLPLAAGGDPAGP